MERTDPRLAMNDVLEFMVLFSKTYAIEKITIQLYPTDPALKPNPIIHELEMEEETSETH